MTTKTEKSANPFELRFEMLQMARDYLDRQLEIQRDAIMNSWHASVAFAEQMKKEVPKMPEMPKMYSIEEMTKMAEQFNAFVSGKK